MSKTGRARWRVRQGEPGGELDRESQVVSKTGKSQVMSKTVKTVRAWW